MLMSGVKKWIGEEGFGAQPASPLDDADRDTAPPVGDDGAPARVLVEDFLWGDGFGGPGGPSEVLRMARPFGNVPDLRILMVGAGAGGAVRALSTGIGATVTGFEADPAVADAAMRRSARAGLSRRAPVHPWRPDRPVFGERSSHHALAIDALRHGPVEPVLAALRLALRARGHLVLTETVLDQPGGQDCAEWLALDGRPAPPPGGQAIARALGRLGFEIRSAEDASSRQMSMALSGWRRAVEAMQQGRLGSACPAGLVAEGELWMLRAKLIQAGVIRHMHWHAVRRAEAD